MYNSQTSELEWEGRGCLQEPKRDSREPVDTRDGLWWSHYQRYHPSRKELGAKAPRSSLGCPLDSPLELVMTRAMIGLVACW